MPLFSSISAALESINFPTNTNLPLNSTMSYLDPFLQGSYFSAATIATVAAVLATSYYVLFNVLEMDKPKGYRDIPQISSLSMIYYTMFKETHIYERYNTVIRKKLEEHGIVRVNMFGRSNIYLGTPQYARQVLLHTETFKKILPTEQFPNSFMSQFFGSNIVFSNNAGWKHHRRICNPAFHKAWSTDIFGDCTMNMLKSIEADSKEGKAVDMTDMFKRITLDALGRAAFGFTFDAVKDPEGEHVKTYYNIMRNAFNPLYVLLPWLDNMPFLRRTKLHELVDEFNGLIFKVIDEKRKKLRDANEKGVAVDNRDLQDLLAMMIQANESDEDPLTNQELRSDVITFFVAGHDTSANALTCTLYRLARDPELQERVHREICDIIGPSNTSNSLPVPSLTQTKEMELLDAVMKETMRIYPSVSNLPARNVLSNTPVGPYIIPPGSEIHVSIYSIHHNAKYWDKPEEFHPERFLPDTDGNTEKRDPTTWVPFSYGSRSCIGTNFSLTEQRVVLSMLIHRFKFSLPADSPHKETPKFNRRGFTSMEKLMVEYTPRY